MAGSDLNKDYSFSGRPGRVSIGNSLQLNKKLSQIRPEKNMDYCRFKIMNSNISEFEVPNSYAMLSFIRRRVFEFARDMAFTKDDLNDIMLAVGEAATNAMIHGSSASSSQVRIRIEKHTDDLHIFVLDSGVNFGYEEWVPVSKGSLEEHGRGITCMRAVMDEVAFHSQETGACVELVKKLPAAV